MPAALLLYATNGHGLASRLLQGSRSCWSCNSTGPMGSIHFDCAILNYATCGSPSRRISD